MSVGEVLELGILGNDESIDDCVDKLGQLDDVEDNEDEEDSLLTGSSIDGFSTDSSGICFRWAIGYDARLSVSNIWSWHSSMA